MPCSEAGTPACGDDAQGSPTQLTDRDAELVLLRAHLRTLQRRIGAVLSGCAAVDEQAALEQRSAPVSLATSFLRETLAPRLRVDLSEYERAGLARLRDALQAEMDGSS